MRGLTDAAKIEELMRELGRRAAGPGRVYLTGGSTAVLMGWRTTTKDVDLKLDPEPPAIFEAIRDLKDALDLNIELAAPDQFLPPVDGWRERSPYVGTEGAVEFYHYDPLSQALAKISRGHAQDLQDVRAMYQRGLFDLEGLRRGGEEILPRMIRYPALDADVFREKLLAVIGELAELSDTRETP